MITYCGSSKTSFGCHELTEHTKLVGNRVKCDTCFYEHEMADDAINTRLKEIALTRSNLIGRLITLDEEEKSLRLKLTPLPQVTPDTWAKSDFELHCYKCNRATRWVHRGRAECHEGCLPGRVERLSSKRKVSGDDLDEATKMLLLAAFNDNIVDIDDADYEVIKATGRVQP